MVVSPTLTVGLRKTEFDDALTAYLSGGYGFEIQYLNYTGLRRSQKTFVESSRRLAFEKSAD